MSMSVYLQTLMNLRNKGDTKGIGQKRERVAYYRNIVIYIYI